MQNEYLEILKKSILNSLSGEDVAIALFGSFAKGTDNYTSDIDIAVIPKSGINRWKLSELREELAELTIPYKIDLVDFSIVSNQFKLLALSGAVWWKR